MPVDYLFRTPTGSPADRGVAPPHLLVAVLGS